MKKIFAILFISFIICKSLFGQENKLSVGIETGPGLVSLWGNKYVKVDRSSFARLNVGIPLYYQLSKSMMIKSGVYYMGKGQANKVELTNENGESIGTGKGKIKLDYLTIPLKVGYIGPGKIQLYADAGIYAEFLLTAKSIAPGFYPSEPTGSIKEYCNKFGLGASLSLGFMVSASEKLKLSFLVQENLGLSGIYKDYTPASENPKTNSTALLVGLVYNLGSKAKQ